jgi:hypothetical protein
MVRDYLLKRGSKSKTIMPADAPAGTLIEAVFEKQSTNA